MIYTESVAVTWVYVFKSPPNWTCLFKVWSWSYVHAIRVLYSFGHQLTLEVSLINNYLYWYLFLEVLWHLTKKWYRELPPPTGDIFNVCDSSSVFNEIIQVENDKLFKLSFLMHMLTFILLCTMFVHISPAKPYLKMEDHQTLMPWYLTCYLWHAIFFFFFLMTWWWDSTVM